MEWGGEVGGAALAKAALPLTLPLTVLDNKHSDGGLPAFERLEAWKPEH